MIPQIVLLVVLFQVEVKSTDPPYHLRIPGGYEQVANPPGNVTSWRRPVNNGQSAVVLSVLILQGTIGKDAADPEQLRASLSKRPVPGKINDVRMTKWRGHDLVLLDTQWDGPDARMFLLSTQIPLAPKALQLHLVGTLENRALILQDFQSVLDSVTGTSNWDLPATLAILIVGMAMAILGWVTYLTYGIAWRFSFRDNPEKALVVRAVWSGVTAALFTGGLLVSFGVGGVLEGPGVVGQLIGVLALIDTTRRAIKLWNSRPIRVIPGPAQKP